MNRTVINQRFEDSLDMGSVISKSDFHSLSTIDFLCGDDYLPVPQTPQDQQHGKIALDFTSNQSPDCDSNPSQLQRQDSRKRMKKVSFSTAEIRSYALIIGDHPECQDGLPLSLDWKYNPQSKIEAVTEAKSYQNCYEPNRLTYFERKMRLLNVSDIEVGEKNVTKDCAESFVHDEVELELEDLLISPAPRRDAFINQAA